MASPQSRRWAPSRQRSPGLAERLGSAPPAARRGRSDRGRWARAARPARRPQSRAPRGQSRRQPDRRSPGRAARHPSWSPGVRLSARRRARDLLGGKVGADDHRYPGKAELAGGQQTGVPGDHLRRRRRPGSGFESRRPRCWRRPSRSPAADSGAGCGRRAGGVRSATARCAADVIGRPQLDALLVGFVRYLRVHRDLLAVALSALTSVGCAICCAARMITSLGRNPRRA